MLGSETGIREWGFWCYLHTGGRGDRGDLEAGPPIHAKRGFRWITRVTMVYQKSNKQINTKQLIRLELLFMTQHV